MEALLIFDAILLLKKPEWSEVGFIWTYCIVNANIRYAEKVIDVLF